ncbi:NAD(P)H-hydrate dehydratase [Undibacterium sp. TS12]|uniref:NAD(P)H-hydrate dehydratase n=1 Tax=Undibacterium sp. TS12 TaxID=2908202 RepID=UPI001F4CC0FB|nr:NAD(P)H-hydrate dehydratase [Undibacterium sp. TS12]MCH8618817.1 NAD(P)H-hydrate dehydratase [Undibacterium sp. TS12]
MTVSVFPPEARLFDVATIREIEARALAVQTGLTLMQKAGLATAEIAIRLCNRQDSHVLVLAGPGNNGGDAYEAACLLAERGYHVCIINCGKAEHYSTDALSALRKAQNLGLSFITVDDLLSGLTQQWGVIIDGLFGIGLKRPPEGSIARLIAYINRLSVKSAIPVLAIDVPSGLNADSGQPVSPEKLAIEASHTVTFIADKPGLHTGAGKDFAGQVLPELLGIPLDLYPPCQMHLNQQSSLPGHLLRRKHDSHKGSFGDVSVLGGATGMAGAAILAARAAQLAGVGRIYCGMLAQGPGYDSLHPELMFRKADDLELGIAAVVIGPGLGQSKSAHDLLNKAIHRAKTLVIDADALNLLAMDRDLQTRLSERSDASVLTPHPLEAARLLKLSVSDVQGNRLSATRELASRFKATVILKGSGSVICDPAGQLLINDSGNPALASGGTGDVLAGVIAALLAQSCNGLDAARLATWAHGHAADQLLIKGIGPLGLTASELLPEIRTILNQLARH